MTREIQLNYSTRISIPELVNMIVSDEYVGDDEVFELIKQLELAIADEDFLKRCFEYFNQQMKESI